MLNTMKKARNYSSPLIQKHLQDIDPVKLEKARNRMMRIIAPSNSCVRCNAENNDFRKNEGDN